MKHYQVILLISSIWLGIILSAITLLIHLDIEQLYTQLIILGLNTICYATLLFNRERIRQLVKTS